MVNFMGLFLLCYTAFMKENYYAGIAHDLFIKWGLLARGWKFEIADVVAGRTTVLGYCDERTFTITLQRSHVELSSEEMVMNTIKHEIAHAMVGCRNGHNAKWKRAARMIGANPESCANRGDLTDEYIKENYKYQLCLVENGVIIERLRMYQKRRSNMEGRYINGRPETTDKLFWMPIEG